MHIGINFDVDQMLFSCTYRQISISSSLVGIQLMYVVNNCMYMYMEDLHVVK